MKDFQPLIDVHCHYTTGAYVDLLDQLGCDRRILGNARVGVFAGTDNGVSARLAMMDASAVEKQIVSMGASTPYLAGEGAAVRAARFLNDEQAELCARHPKRFGFFATLPMPHVDATLAEVQRAFDDLHANGVTLTTSINSISLTDPAFEPVFAELNRRSAILFLHPAGFACESHVIAESGLTWGLGAPIEDAVCALQLVRADFPTRYPKLKVIVPHLGGFLPFLMYRLDKGGRNPQPPEKRPGVLLQKFWFDTANGEAGSLRLAAEKYGADRLLYGSDFPYWSGTAYDRSSAYLTEADLDAAQVNAIRSGNARALLG